jgi:hypothetical protein
MAEVVLDTNVLIDLLDLSCFEALGNLREFRFWVVENVRHEVSREDQKVALAQALDSGLIRETRVGEEEACAMEELSSYARLKGVLGDGEAASLAVAYHRGWLFVSYEKGRLRREAEAMLRERFWSTPRLLAAMIRAGATTLDRLKSAIASGPPGSTHAKTQHLSRVVAEAEALIPSEGIR